jgi:drug/metabolite transporter (DMT)-like permease
LSVLLALVSAVAYGCSDFVGGLVSRRASVWSVAVVLQASSAVCTALVSPFVGGAVTVTDLGWATLSGVGSGVGVCFLFRGLSRGRMAVVAPLSAVGAAVLPLVVALLAGERPSALDLVALSVALPGIWLVSSSEAGQADRSDEDASGLEARTAGVADGLVAGVGFGVMFVALAQVGDGSGLWPVAHGQLVSAVTAVGLALGLRASWRPATRRHMVAAAAGGPLGALAVVAFTLSARGGLLSVSAVLSSLYPAATILLAATVLHERIRRPQLLGLLLCGVTVSLLALG